MTKVSFLIAGFCVHFDPALSGFLVKCLCAGRWQWLPFLWGAVFVASRFIPLVSTEMLPPALGLEPLTAGAAPVMLACSHWRNQRSLLILMRILT